MREFSTFHPFTLFAYFLSVLCIGMSILQPIMVFLLLFISILFYQEVFHKIKRQLKFLILSFLVIAISNPIFVHQGVSILFYFQGNPITFEAIAYGAAFGATLCAIWNICASFQVLMSSDQWIYLFGRFLPSLGLVISMSIRLISKLKKQSTLIVESQHLLGNDISQGSLWKRGKMLLQIFSILITWAFETSIDSADSMKARGYGTSMRTSFHNYHWGSRDVYFLVFIIVTCGLCIYTYQIEFSKFYYYPHIREVSVSGLSIVTYCVYAGYLLFPILYERKERNRWKSFVSNM